MEQAQDDQPTGDPEGSAAPRLVTSYERVMQYAYGTTRPEGAAAPSSSAGGDSADRLDRRPLTTWRRIVQALGLTLVPISHRAQWSRWRVGRLPRAQWFLRFFVIDHLRSSLAVFHRRQTARIALGTPDTPQDRQAVEQYLESLPSSPRLLYSTTLAAATVVLTRFVLLQIPGAARQFGALDTPTELVLIEQVLAAVAETTSDITPSGSLLTALTSAPPRTIAFIAASLATVLYAELRWLVPAFRLHRMACNLDDNIVLLDKTPASWSVQRATGVYRIEREVARELGVPPPREVPFDLIVSALALPWALFLAWMLYEAGNANRFLRSEPLLSYTLASGVLAVVALRAFWLVRAWRRRVADGEATHLPVEVEVGSPGPDPTSRVVTSRDPVGLLVASAIATGVLVGVAIANGDGGHSDLVTMGGGPAGSPAGTARLTILCLVVAPLWWLMARDLAAYLEPSTWRRHLHPAAATAAMVAAGLLLTTTHGIYTSIAVLLIAWSVAVTYRRLRRAFDLARTEPHRRTPHARPDRPPLNPWALVAACAVLPVVVALVQRALNALWNAAGSALDDPGHAVTPPLHLGIAPTRHADVSVDRSTAQVGQEPRYLGVTGHPCDGC